MFAISWVLVIVAAAALVGGIYEGGIALILVAIGGALGAAIFLGIGILQGRAVEPVTSDDHVREDLASEEPEATPRIVFVPPPATGPAPEVMAIPARGTYHEPGCRLVAGRPDAEALSMATARSRGHSPCTVCSPG